MILAGLELGTEKLKSAGFVFHPGSLLGAVCPGQSGKAAVLVRIGDRAIAQQGAIDESQVLSGELASGSHVIFGAALPITVSFFEGMSPPVGLDAAESPAFLLEKFGYSQFFATATLALGTKRFGLGKDIVAAITFLPVGVALELVTADKAPYPAIGAIFEDLGAATAGTGDSIVIPALTSFAATHPVLVRIK